MGSNLKALSLVPEEYHEYLTMAIRFYLWFVQEMNSNSTLVQTDVKQNRDKNDLFKYWIVSQMNQRRNLI